MSVNPLFCAHSETTAPDGSGRAICTRCSSLVRTHLTLDMLLLAQDQVLYGTSYEDAWGNRIDPKNVHGHGGTK